VFLSPNASVYPVRNNAPLLCTGVRFWNNSGRVQYHARFRVATTGISNGVYSEKWTIVGIPEVEEASVSEGFSLGEMVSDGPKKGLVSGKSV
jgi:hypothetical protein